MSGIRGFGALALGSAVLGVLLGHAAGCGGEDGKDRLLATVDAADAGTPEASEGDATPITLDPTLGGPCTDDAQCDDQIPCTFDRCDKDLSRCRNTPDDAQCSDGQFCNGNERCVLRKGCAPGAVVTCHDENGCTIDRCIEATDTCEHVPRDSDGDGDPDDHCAPTRDCDDTDPNISSKHAEVCGNFKDDNCNGQVDESPCTVPANDTCAAARPVTAPGSLLLTTVATKQDYGTTCATSITGAQDIVLAVTVPAGGGPKDVIVRAQTSKPGAEVALALEKTCGVSATEIQCQRLSDAQDARAIARSVAAGQTIYAIVTTKAESPVDVKVDFAAPTVKPANESCAAPQAVAVDTPFAVSLIDAARDLPSECRSRTGDLTYTFELKEKRDVRVFATPTFGNGEPVVSLRAAAAACATAETHCREGSQPPLFARGLAPGKYVLSVAASAQIDASILVKTSPATEPPLDQSCATAPTMQANVTIPVDLSNHEDAIQNGCFAGNPNAAYTLPLAGPSDLLIIARFPLNEIGGIALNKSDCTTADLLGCSEGGTPQRVSRRNISAGDYRVVVADQFAQSAEIIALVRPTLAPVTVTADGCMDAQVIPETGGYFVGDTTNKTADFNSGCDTAGQPVGTAKDQLLKLVLTQKRRVVFDMSGSQMQTLLDIRTGDPCPGVEVPFGCAPPFTSNRSFLDMVLSAGTYWVQIDGYNGGTGQWALDVRVLAP